MKQVQLFSCCIISVVMLLTIHVTLASPVKQRGLREKLDDLKFETQEQNILRRKEIKELYTMMERLEERLNDTSPIVDTDNDITKLSGVPHMSTGTVAVDEKRIAKVLKEFVRLKQGMRDEKRLAAHLRGQVEQLNITMGQLISQSEQTMDAVNTMVHLSLNEVNSNFQTLQLGQEQLRVVDNETRRLITNLEKGLQELNVTVAELHKEYTSCVDHRKNGHIVSGVYDIALSPGNLVKVSNNLDLTVKLRK